MNISNIGEKQPKLSKKEIKDIVRQSEEIKAQAESDIKNFQKAMKIANINLVSAAAIIDKLEIKKR